MEQKKILVAAEDMNEAIDRADEKHVLNQKEIQRAIANGNTKDVESYHEDLIVERDYLGEL